MRIIHAQLETFGSSAKYLNSTLITDKMTQKRLFFSKYDNKIVNEKLDGPSVL